MKKILLLVSALVVAVLIYSVLTLDSRIRQHLEETLSYLTGVPVSVQSVKLSLFDANGAVLGLTVKNPEGYSDGDAIVMDAIRFSIDRSTLFSQPLVLNSLVFESPVINLEVKENFRSNLKDIVEVSNRQLGIKKKKRKKPKDKDSNAGAGSPETEGQRERGEKEGGTPKKSDTYQMLIREIRVDNLTLNAEYAGKQWTETIEEMEIKGIGKKHSVNTRALGIMMVRKLTKKATREAMKRKAENVTQEEIEELGTKLLESLLNKN